MKKMKSGDLPCEKWEKTMDSLEVGGGKYCSEPAGAPQELKESADKLAQYVKKNSCKKC